MIIKHHDLELYYLQRRIELLHILDQFAQETLSQEDFVMEDNHWKMEIIKDEYDDVIDPKNLCQTLQRIYPEHLFGIENNGSNLPRNNNTTKGSSE